MTIMSLKPKIDHQVEKPKTSVKSFPLKFKVGNKKSWVSPGIYQVKIVRIEKKTPFKDKPVLEFLFEITSGEYKGIELRGFCNANYEIFSENTKLYQWYAAVTGDVLGYGDELDTNVFFDKIIEVQIEEKISKKTKNKFSNVTKIIRMVYEL